MKPDHLPLLPLLLLLPLLATVECTAAPPRRPDPTATEPERAGAITAGLDWLVRHADPAGGWRVAGFQRVCPEDPPCGGTGALGVSGAVTGLAIEAFLDAPASLHPEGADRAVERAVSWLESRARSTGRIGPSGGMKLRFEHGHALRALCRVRTAADDPAGPVLEAAVDWLLEDAASPDLADCEVACYLGAIEAARATGLEIPAGVVEDLPRRVRRDREAGGAVTSASDAALALALLATDSPDEEAIGSAVDAFAGDPPGPESPDVYLAGLGRRVLRRAGRPGRAEAFARPSREDLLARQATEGGRAGSWAPGPDRWGSAGGRVFVTAAGVRLLIGESAD